MSLGGCDLNMLILWDFGREPEGKQVVETKKEIERSALSPRRYPIHIKLLWIEKANHGFK